MLYYTPSSTLLEFPSFHLKGNDHALPPFGQPHFQYCPRGNFGSVLVGSIYEPKSVLAWNPLPNGQLISGLYSTESWK